MGRINKIQVLERYGSQVALLKFDDSLERIRTVGTLPQPCSDYLWQRNAVKVPLNLVGR